MALNWNDVDFDKKTIRVNKSLSYKVEGKKYIITSPKTENSNRITDIDNNLIELLKKHYEKESKICNFRKDMFIFGNINPIAETTLRRHLNKYLKLSGI